MKLNIADRDGFNSEIEQGGTRTTYTYQQVLEAATSSGNVGASLAECIISYQEGEEEEDSQPVSRVRARERKNAKRREWRQARRQTLEW